jgi:carboxyl-terminal processing protease
MNRTTKIVVIALSLTVFSYAALGYVLSRTADEKSYRSLTVYGEVLNKIQEDYVEEPNMAKVSVGGLHGLVESLDAMSSYMSPAEYADYKKQMASHPQGQIGAVLAKRSAYVMVVSVQVGSPAEKAGLLPGDLIEAIAGLATIEMSENQAMQLFSGAPGKQVKFSVVKRGAARQTDSPTEEKTVTLATVAQANVTVTKLSAETAYVRVPSLEAGKADELRAKLVELDHSGVHKIILDVRGCALGEIPEGIAAAKLFLSTGTIASLKGQTVTKQDFVADASKVVWKNPVVVLTSGATSGAAEILAGSISGNKRGDVVGERTFGSASQQKLIQLDDGAAVNLTVAFYYTPNGKSIPQEGVTPTTEVTNPTDDPLAYSRAQNPPLTPGDSKSDPVLSKGLELLNGAKVAEHREPQRRAHFAYPVPV